MQKKIFYLSDDETMPVVAGGILLYKIKNHKIYFLMIDNHGNYEDFGGKFYQSDDNIFDTIVKQASKQSNFLLNEDKIKERMLSATYVYIKHSKYIVYLINANEQEQKENYDNTIKWVQMRTLLRPEVIKHKINIRLKDKSFFDTIKKILKDILEWEILE
jgi:hypothetical protein